MMISLELKPVTYILLRKLCNIIYNRAIAPELLKAGDVFKLGMAIRQLVRPSNISYKYYIKNPDNYKIIAQNIINDCLNIDPLKRPTSSDILDRLI